MPQDVHQDTCGELCPDHGTPCPVCPKALEDEREFYGEEEVRSLADHRKNGLHLCLHPARNGDGDPHTWN